MGLALFTFYLLSKDYVYTTDSGDLNKHIIFPVLNEEVGYPESLSFKTHLDDTKIKKTNKNELESTIDQFLNCRFKLVSVRLLVFFWWYTVLGFEAG